MGKSHLPWCYVHEYCTYARGAVTHCDGTFLGEARNIVIRTQHLLAVVCTHNIGCLPGSVVGARRHVVAFLPCSLCVHLCWLDRQLAPGCLLWRSCHAACAYTFVAMLPRLGGRTEASASAGSVAMLPFGIV